MEGSPPVSAAAAADAPLRGRRVLVVEDEALVAMLVEDGLRGAGAEVLGPAASVADALRIVEGAVAAGGGLDAAVLDLNLAGRAVRPVADRLAALGVPFLFATGYGEGCDTGGHAAPMVQKPFDPEELVAAVGALAPPPSARCGGSRGDQGAPAGPPARPALPPVLQRHEAPRDR